MTTEALGNPVAHARVHYTVKVVAAMVAVVRHIEFDVGIVCKCFSQFVDLRRENQLIECTMPCASCPAYLLCCPGEVDCLFEVQRSEPSVVVARGVGEADRAWFSNHFVV